MKCTYSLKDDSWALGALFTEMLLGEQMWSPAMIRENSHILNAARNDNDIVAVLRSIPYPQAADAIAGLLKYNRGQRSTIAEFLNHAWFKGMSWGPKLAAGVVGWRKDAPNR